jgi:hypothetical protein
MAQPSITMEFIPMPVTGKSSNWFSTFASIGEDTFRAASKRPRILGLFMGAEWPAGALLVMETWGSARAA